MSIYLYPSNTETEISNAYIWIPYPESITLDKSSISLSNVWDTVQLTATLEPTVCDQSITWSSDDTTVATVSTTGLVTCVTPWDCTITATTVNWLTATCGVTNGWTPWANTVAYYEFDWNLNDSSWNGHNLSLYTWSVTYWTASWGWKYAYFNQNTWTNYWTRNVNYNWNNTICFWVNTLSSFTSWWPHNMVELWCNSWNNYCRISQNVSFSWNAISTAWETSLSANVWHLLGMSCDWTTFYFYLDWVCFATSSKAVSWTYNSRFRVNQVPDTSSSSYAHNMYISKLIWEEAFRTANDFSAYFNKTKWDYWLS